MRIYKIEYWIFQFYFQYWHKYCKTPRCAFVTSAWFEDDTELSGNRSLT